MQKKYSTKTVCTALVVAMSALSAAPAFADAPSGPRVEAMVGVDSTLLNDKTYGTGRTTITGFYYGGGLGYDFALSPNFSLGIDGELASATSREPASAGLGRLGAGRDLYAGLRGTFVVARDTNLYVKLGYASGTFKIINGSNAIYSGNNNNFRVGVGIQQNFSKNIYGFAEYRYSAPLDSLSRNQVVTGLGIRF